MNEQILDYVNSQSIAVLAVQMPDNAPHAATMHFGFLENPNRFIVVTNKDSKKCIPLLQGETANASFVIGQSEADMKSLQMDGVVEMATDESVSEEFFAKFPDKKGRYNSETDAILVFTPTWWRYSDYKNSNDKLIIES